MCIGSLLISHEKWQKRTPVCNKKIKVCLFAYKQKNTSQYIATKTKKLHGLLQNFPNKFSSEHIGLLSVEPVFEQNKPALQKSPPLITHENGKNGPLFCNKKIKVRFFANER